MEETNNLIFTLTAILAIAMTLIYFPLRFFLTLTARSRRLKLLQKISCHSHDIGIKVLVEGRNWSWLQDKARELVEFLPGKVKLAIFL